MRDRADSDKAMSTLVEYLLLIGILSVFLIGVSLHLNDVLKESQVRNVMENRFSDVAAQVSTIYTDYILLRPENGWIKTQLALSPKIGDSQYKIALEEVDDYAFVKVYGDENTGYSGLGYTKFVFGKGKIGDVISFGETQSAAANPFSKHKPVIGYERKEDCPVIPRPRLDLNPSSVDLNTRDNVSIRVYIENADEITKGVNWTLRLWNGSVIEGSGERTINAALSWYPQGCDVNGYNATCFVEVDAYVEGREDCNASFRTLLLVSKNPPTAPPYLVYEKWVEPSVVTVGEDFDVHIRLEGRGFLGKYVNLTTVHVLDNSGSMLSPALVRDITEKIEPKVVKANVSVGKGDVIIKAYTTAKLPNWYSDDFCGACWLFRDQCPWYGSGYDDGFVKLYINGTEYSKSIGESGKFGVRYEETISSSKKYVIEVVARAPQPIDLHMEVYRNGSLVFSRVVDNYTNYRDVEITLAPGIDYTFLMLDGVSGIPRWSYLLYDTPSTVERYDAGCQVLYWEYSSGYCGLFNFFDGVFNVWVIEPNGEKSFLLRSWYRAENNYDFYHIDFFKSHPQPGVYKIRIVPTGKDAMMFSVKVYLKRIEAAKTAVLTYNSLLGSDDFTGLVKFSTSADRFAVGSPPLRYLTRNVDNVNSALGGIKPSCATDPAEGLYRALRVFPVWGESENNCTSCIANTQPVVVLLTDGEPTMCDPHYLNCSCSGSCNGYSYCTDAELQARCVAEEMKRTYIGERNITLCTIAFSDSVGGDGREFLKDIASPRPDSNEKCYFFAEGVDDLVRAYKTIYSAFKVVARDIVLREVLNTTLIPELEYVSYTATSSEEGKINDRVTVKRLSEGTAVILNLTSLKEGETIDLVIKVRAKSTGVFPVNHNSSYVEYDALNYNGEYRKHVRLEIDSAKARVKVIGEGDAIVNLE